MGLGGGAGPFLIGLDCGTQSVRALLADARGRTLACAARPTPTIAIAPDQAEHDPEALWQAACAGLRELATKIPAGGEVAGIACASMGEACVLLDAEDAPLARTITWFDRRTEPLAAAFAERVGIETLFDRTGLPADPTVTLAKLLWHRATDPAGFARARRVLNLADYLAYRLCGEAATDLSLASRTQLLDIATLDWSEAMLRDAGLDRSLLPPIRPSGTRIGPVRGAVLEATGLPGRPVVAVGGHDHVCGAFAAGVVRPGILLDSMGTAEALFATVDRPVVTRANRHLGFWQGVLGIDRRFAYVGAGINSSGGAVEWLRRLFGDAADRAALIAEAAALAPGSGGVVFLPHLAYATPPIVDLEARGAFLGLTAATTRAALFRAVLEGLAMEARLCVDAVAALPGAGRPDEIRVIGGSTRNALWLGIKAAVFGRPLTVIEEPEATALGAALLGGVAAGLWPDLPAALRAIAQPVRVVAPDPAWAACYDRLFRSIYERLYPTLAPLTHALARDIAGGVQ
jgi:xylulokinase